MYRVKLIFTTVLFFYIFNFPSLAQDNICLQNRTVFDFGSGAIKAKSVMYNTCDNKIERELGEASYANNFADCILESDDSSLSNHCIDKAVIAVDFIQNDLSLDCTKNKCFGVATAWARLASNTDKLIAVMSDKNIKIEVLSQNLEGEYGFKAAATNYLRSRQARYEKLTEQDKLEMMKELFVIDIGAASFQMSCLDEEGDVFVHNGNYGVVSYEHALKARLRGHYTANSPYFHGKALEHALLMSISDLGEPINNNEKAINILNSLKAKNRLYVIGIGSVFNGAIHKEMKLPNVLKKEHLVAATKKFKSKSFANVKKTVFPYLNRDYFSSAQASLISVYGIMSGAKIEEINIINVSINDYIISNSSFWK